MPGLDGPAGALAACGEARMSVKLSRLGREELEPPGFPTLSAIRSSNVAINTPVGDC
jgi:hypothetical protein